MLQTLVLGFQNFVGNELNVMYHSDLELFKKTLGSGLRIVYLVGFLEFGFCLFLVISGNLSNFLSIPNDLIAKHRIGLGLLLLMAMWWTLGSGCGIISRIMMPAGLLCENIWFDILAKLVQFALFVVIAVYGGSILAVCISYAIVQSIMILYRIWYLRFKLPQFFPWWRHGDWHYGFHILRKSLMLAFNSIFTQLSNNGLLIFISALFTSAVIPSFTTLRTLINSATTVTNILMTSLLPDMMRFHATRDIEKIKAVINANWFISGLCVNFCIIILLPVIEKIYNIWTKGILLFNGPLFLLLSATISLTNFGAGLTTYLSGINDLRSQTYIAAGRFGTLFIVAYLLSRQFGILSVGIGLVVSELVASVVLPILFVNRCFAVSMTSLSKRQIVLAIIPPTLLLSVGLISTVSSVRLEFITLVMVPTFIVLYYINWMWLNTAVKDKIAGFIVVIMHKFAIR